MADLFCCIRDRKVINQHRDKKPDAADTSTSEEDIILDLSKNEGADYQRELWRQALDEGRKSFEARQKRVDRPGDSVRNASDSGDNASGEAWLQRLTVQYNERGWRLKMATVRDVFQTIRPFTSAVTTLAQSNDVAQVVWGSLMLVFEVSALYFSGDKISSTVSYTMWKAILRFANLWDDLNSLLESLTIALPRFHLYTAIYHTPRLHKSLRLIYRRFIDICFMTQDFLEETCMSKLYLKNLHDIRLLLVT